MKRRTRTPSLRRSAQTSLRHAVGGRLSLRMHCTVAILAICALTVAGFVDRETFSTKSTYADTHMAVAQISVRHTQPATLSLVLARKGTAGYISILNTSDTMVSLTLPKKWNRSEVTNAPLAAFSQKSIDSDTMQWDIPAKAGMKMFTTDVPTSLSFLSAGAHPLSITIHTLDLLTDIHNTNVILLSNSAVYDELWSRKE